MFGSRAQSLASFCSEPETPFGLRNSGSTADFGAAPATARSRAQADAFEAGLVDELSRRLAQVGEDDGALYLEPAFFCEERHDASEAADADAGALAGSGLVSRWRMKDRMKTVSVALIMCLNIGVDPPDVLKIAPCARAECWINPLVGAPAKALDAIGKALQAQYERWQPRARYKAALDPTAEDVRKLCMSCRRNAKGERVLVHYTGHGVPRPTPNGEIWVFNKSYTQYIPLSIFDLHAWTGTPAIYVLDCSGAGHILNALAAYGEARADGSGGGGGLGALMGPPGGGDARAAGASGRGGGAAAALLGLTADAAGGAAAGGPSSPGDGNGENAAAAREVVMLAACAADELLPCSPDLPADVFTACLTSPIKMALRWFCLRSPLRHEAGLDPELADAIPGLQNNRKTPLGELNWIFTAITDTIAWNVLPRPLFQRLFRQDLLVASLFRNYLLAERVLRALGCTPRSSPALPATAGHPMWAAWDMALEACLLQLPALLAAEAAGTPAEFVPSPFFSDQLSAFEVWLEHGADDDAPQPPPQQHGSHHHGYAGYDDDVDAVAPPPSAAAAAAAAHAAAAARAPPEQLPIVLQVLLSQSHRLRALVLLGRFLDKGPWAVDLALSVGIFPYVLKLLQTTAADLRHILVFIWTKILALDRSCQADLIKDNAFVYFIRFLDAPEVAPEERALAAFALACVCDGHARGQAACAAAGLGPLCLGQLAAAAEAPRGATLLRWLALALAKLWAGNAVATASAFAESAPEALAPLLAHPSPELRAAGVAALGALVAPPRGMPAPPPPPPPPAAASPPDGSPAGAAAAPPPAGEARDPMSEAARHAAERAVVSQLLPLAADGSPVVRREVVCALARVAAGHPAHFHAAQMAWQRAGRTGGAGSASGSAAAAAAAAMAAEAGGSTHLEPGSSAPQRAASGAASAAAAAASAAAAAVAMVPPAAQNGGGSGGGGGGALSQGQRNSSSGYFSPSPAVGDMSFGDVSAASALSDGSGAAAAGDDAAAAAARLARASAAGSAVPRVPSNLGRASSSSIPSPAPVAVPVSPAAGSLAGVAVFADADGALLFAPTPPPLGGAGSAGSGGAGSSVGGSSMGLYASADAARLGGGLYAHVLEALLASARDPAPRVAAAGRQALEALGAERLLGPAAGCGTSSSAVFGGSTAGSGGREAPHLARAASLRAGSTTPGDAPLAGSYGSSWGGGGGGGRLMSQLSGLPERPERAPSGSGATWTQRLSSWVGSAVGGGGGSGGDSPTVQRRGSDSASSLALAQPGSSHGGGFALAHAMDVRQSDGSAALAMLQGGGASVGERGGSTRLTLGDLPGGSQRGGVGGSQRGGSAAHGFGAAAALQAALPPLPSSTAFEHAAVHFSRPLLAPAASPAVGAGEEAAVEEAPEEPPPGVPAWARRPDAAARSARRAAAASRAARAAAAPPTGCTELLGSLEPDTAAAGAGQPAATTALCMHPLRPLVAVGDAAGVVRVWARPEPGGGGGGSEGVGVVSRFRAAAGGRALAALALLNPYDDPLLVACGADGAVRIWRDWCGAGIGGGIGGGAATTPGLAAAWRALPGALPTRPPPRWPAAFALQQEAGCLYAAGEAGGGGGGALHVWDLGREACADAVPLSTLAAGAGVTCLSAAAGALLLGGASDGRLLSFDLRAPARLLSSARLHTAPLRGVLLQPGGAPHALITASAAGELVWTDLRAVMEPLAVVQAHRADSGGLTALAGHAAAPLVATGGAERTVRLFDVAARPLGALKYAPAFMAPRAVPVACLAFAPAEALLCAGGGDGGAALYAQPELRRGSRDDHAYAYAAA